MMKISKADQSALVIAFAELLQRGEVSDWGYAPVGKDWESETLGSLSDEGCKTLKSVLDPSLEAFYQERVFHLFFTEGNELPSEGEKALISCKGFKNPLKVARDFISFLAESPYTYRLVVASSKIFDGLELEGDQLKISDRLFLESGKHLKTRHTFSHSNKAIEGRIKRLLPDSEKMAEIRDDEIYFVYHTSGICSRSRHTDDMQDELRAFLGSLIAFDVVYPFSFFFKDSRRDVFTNMIRSEGFELVGVGPVESDIRDAMSFLVKSEIKEKANKLNDILKGPLALFASEETNRLKTAASWIFRAHISSKPIDQALEAAIAIEVLLGDRDTSDRIGLSKLMANRCAYSLGKSQKERKSLNELFINFYKVRSEIVHAGRYKVSDDDRSVVMRGRSLAARLLRHEVEVS